MTPIWKDYPVSLGADAVVEFQVKSDGNAVIYRGKSYKRPGDTQNAILLNRIAADYLAQSLPDLSANGFNAAPIAETFSVDKVVNGVISFVMAEQFVFDWSYTNRLSIDAAAPIDGVLDPRLPMLFTSYAFNSSYTLTLTKSDGSTQQVTPTGNGAGTLVFRLPADVVSASIRGFVYEVRKSCASYALIYVNAFGGWDSLSLADAELLTDSYNRSQYRKAYDTADLSARGTTDYLNEITRSWQLYTNYLTDEQSKRMYHLFGSNDVYLYDLVAAQAMPVVLTDKSHNYKTFQNQGRKLVNYSLTVQLAQERIRR